MYNKTVLANGCRVMIIDMPHMESVALGVWIGAGGRYENKKNTGISHYLEHMVFKGTSTRSTKDIKESIEGIGGSLNGFTDEEATCYYVKVPNKYVELGLDVLSDMVINPKISKHELEKERGVIYEEMKMYRDRPDHYVQQLLSELLWTDHPLGMPLVGFEGTLSKLDIDDLHEYKERFYTPSNIVITVAGRVDKDLFAKMTQAHFSKLKKTPLPHFKKFSQKQKKARFNLFHKVTEQTHLAIGFHNVSRFDPEKYTTTLLHIILGGNMSSRLFHEVREERGLAYDIGTAKKHYMDTGAFLIGAGLDNKRLGSATDIIASQLRKIKKIRVKEDELRRAKDFYKGQLAMALEGTLSRMLWTGEKLITKDINYNIDEAIDSINSVTADMIRDMAQKTFRMNNLNVAVIGPLSKKDEKSIKKNLRM